MGRPLACKCIHRADLLQEIKNTINPEINTHCGNRNGNLYRNKYVRLQQGEVCNLLKKDEEVLIINMKIL